MNMNNEMKNLRDMGARKYSPDSDNIRSLVTRARRRRTARTVGISAASSATALLVAVVGVQVAQVVQELDAGRSDRNLIERSFEELFDSKYAADNGAYGGDINLDEIFAQLNNAAQTETTKPSQNTGESNNGGSGSGSGSDSGSSGGSGGTCTDDTTTYEYKWYDCSAEKWKIKDGWYQDVYGDNSWRNCATDGGISHPAQGVYYNCDYGTWKSLEGWILLGDAAYQCVNWYDRATGTWYWGAYASPWNKLLICSGPNATYYSEYTYLDGVATWASNGDGTYKCKGNEWTDSDTGAPFAFECRTGDTILTDSDYKKFVYSVFYPGSTLVKYWHKDDIVYHEDDSYFWNGSAWTQTPA